MIWKKRKEDKKILKTYRETKNWSVTAVHHNICVRTAKRAVKRASKAEAT